MRYDLAFFLCCCKSFLGADEGGSAENFYGLLGVESDASQDEIKRAYKRKSLQMHPDKLAQRGRTVTEEDQARFTRMKEAYECLSDPHKRETYDAIGERGMKWLDEPMSMDPQELAHNFTKSSVLDRSKIFGIFVAIAIVVLTLPVVVCLHVDGAFGRDASWMATLIPLWIWNISVLFYHSRVIAMPNIRRPEDVPPEEWVDPLPMKERIVSLVRFLLVALFELLVGLKLDNRLDCKWAVVFIPLFVWEATTLYEKWLIARLKIVTIEDLETALGKSYFGLTTEEKESIGKLYSVVPSLSGREFQTAQKTRARARQDMTKSGFRALFVIFLVIQIDTDVDFNWWLIFLPIWIMTFLICAANCQAFAEVQHMAAEKDPGLFGLSNDEEMDYGSVGRDGAATPEAASAGALPRSELSEEEKERLKEQVINSGSTLCTQCCSQGFVLILVFLIVGKLQGAGFSTLLLISPFLFAAGIILCCLGCAIFGISDLPDGDGVGFDSENMVDLLGENSGSKNSATVPVSFAMNQNEDAQPLSRPSQAQTNDAKIGGQTADTLSASMPTGSNKSKNTTPILEID